MMRKKIISCLMLLVIALQSVCFASNWVWLNSTDTYSTYIDTSTIKREYSNNPYVKRSVTKGYAWIKTVYTQEYADEDAIRYNDERFTNTSYVLSYLTFEKNPKRSAILAVYFYDHNGNCFESATYSYAKYDFIIPESIGELMYEYVIGK